jgi:hypothetical protein
MSSSEHELNKIHEGVSKVLNANRDQVIDFATTHKYDHKGNIKDIPVNTQFYEVNLNNNMISREKKRENDNDNYKKSSAPHFIITDANLDSHSIVDWALNLSKKGGSSKKRGGNRTRMRKSSQKRRTTKRR